MFYFKRVVKKTTKKKNVVAKDKVKVKKEVKVKVELDWNDAMLHVYVDDSDREIILID